MALALYHFTLSQQLTSGESVRLQNAVAYSTGNEGQNTLALAITDLGAMTASANKRTYPETPHSACAYSVWNDCIKTQEVP